MVRSPKHCLFVVAACLICLALLSGCSGTAAPTAVPTESNPSATQAPSSSTPSAVTPSAVPTTEANPSATSDTIVPVKAGPKMPAPVKLGFVSSLTGAVSDASVSNQRGFEQAIADFNAAGGFGGVPVEGVIYDDAANPEKAVDLTNRLISSDKVAAIVGYNSSGCALAAIDITQKAKIPMMATGGGVLAIVNRYANEPQNFQFGVRHLDIPQAQLAIQFMRDKRGVPPEKFGVMHDPTGYGADAAQEFVGELAKLGVTQPCGNETVAVGTTDTTPQIQKLISGGCKAVMNYSTGTARANAFRTAAKIGGDFQTVLDWGGSQPALYNLVGQEVMEDIIFTQAFAIDQSPEAAALAERLEKVYGELLYPLVSAQGYDGTMLLLQAISAAGSTDGTKIAEALEQITGFKGTTTVDAAPFTHTDHEGLDRAEQFFMATWKDGKVIKITE